MRDKIKPTQVIQIHQIVGSKLCPFKAYKDLMLNFQKRVNAKYLVEMQAGKRMTNYTLNKHIREMFKDYQKHVLWPKFDTRWDERIGRMRAYVWRVSQVGILVELDTPIAQIATLTRHTFTTLEKYYAAKSTDVRGNSWDAIFGKSFQRRHWHHNQKLDTKIVDLKNDYHGDIYFDVGRPCYHHYYGNICI